MTAVKRDWAVDHVFSKISGPVEEHTASLSGDG